jgi:hypothetical protein
MRKIPCESAWVVTAPPSYAPDMVSVSTLDDLLRSTFIDRKWLREPKRVSFREDILPILRRLSVLQWVNRGFAAQFGFGGAHNFDDPKVIDRLSRPPKDPAVDTYSELRLQIADSFRVYDRDGMSPLPWPWIYGDAQSKTAYSVRQHHALTPLQMRQLSQWAAGNFRGSGRGNGPVHRDLGSLPVHEQPGMLDRAALTFCIADAFHPGCELPWIMRNSAVYTKPYRIRPRAAAGGNDFGPILTPSIALGPDGPLSQQGPGDLTRWMSVPWQTDSASCRSGYDPDYDPTLPSFWPARAPNQVLAIADYRRAMDRSLSDEKRTEAFLTRSRWLRRVAKTGWSRVRTLNAMVRKFPIMGVVEAREGADDGVVPGTIYVESGRRH